MTTALPQWRRDTRRMLDLLRPEAWHYALGLLALAVVNLSDVIGPLFIGVAVDLLAGRLSGKGPGTPHLLNALGFHTSDFTLTSAVAIYLALQVVGNVLRYPMLMEVSVPSNRIGQRLRNELVDHLLRLPRPFYDHAKSGDVMARGTSDVGAVRMFFGPGILLLFDTAMLLVLVLTVMFALSWTLTVAALIPLPLIALFTQQFSLAEFRRHRAVQEDVARLTERAREVYAGIRIVQGYAREEEYRARFAEHSRAHFRLNLALTRIRSLFDPSLDLLLGLSTVLVLVFGGGQIARGTITVGTFVAFLFLVGNLSGPMVGFGWAVSLLQRGRASLQRIDALLAEPVTIADAPGAREAGGPGRIEVRGLTFAYGDGPPALSDVSFELAPGKRLGVIGPVGCGKSTLVSLLARLYDPPPGTVLLDGVDVRELTLASLRRAIAVAPQDTFLFSDTVGRNVRLAPEAADRDAWELVRLAAIEDEVAALPEQLETLLGERGINLSGGQRQRLAIARAAGADARVLVLDDCLSAVDARTEAAILGRLDEVFAGRGGIIVSHRVRAVAHCDEILVLAAGRIAARGTHDQLIAVPGYYADIAHEQTREASDVETPAGDAP